MNLPLTSQVCSLPISQEIDRLHKERGIEFESHFWWVKDMFSGTYTLENWKNQYAKGCEPENAYIPTFSVSELGMLLPAMIKDEHFLSQKSGRWQVSYEPIPPVKEHHRYCLHFEISDTEADARGFMYLYLLKNNLITNT